MTPILAPGGKLRGYLRYTSTGKELLSPGGRLLGYYNSDTDETFFAGGRFYGYGDQLTNLLEE